MNYPRQLYIKAHLVVGAPPLPLSLHTIRSIIDDPACGAIASLLWLCMPPSAASVYPKPGTGWGWGLAPSPVVASYRGQGCGTGTNILRNGHATRRRRLHPLLPSSTGFGQPRVVPTPAQLSLTLSPSLMLSLPVPQGVQSSGV